MTIKLYDLPYIDSFNKSVKPQKCVSEFCVFAADEVASKLEESDDQIKTMKRKHAAVVKVCIKFLITSFCTAALWL